MSYCHVQVTSRSTGKVLRTENFEGGLADIDSTLDRIVHAVKLDLRSRPKVDSQEEFILSVYRG